MVLNSSFFSSILNAAQGTWRMSFQSIHYLFFLPVVVAGYFLLPVKFRKVWLLIASYYFYFFAAPKFLPLLIISTLFTYCIGRLIGHAKTKKQKNIWLFIGIIGIIGVLAFFKYNRFITDALTSFWANFGLTYQTNWFTTAAALGISYYSFTAIGYLVEVAQNTTPAEKNFGTYALFLGFFPSISLGPINRANGLLAQLQKTNNKFNPATTANALRLIGIGFFKKLVVADTLQIYVNAVYATPESLSTSGGLTIALATILFTFQLYFDFSGYTDIARGSAELLGITLPQNFNTPFFSTNYSEFWSRWHMSLSSWLQDYIFTPLVWSRWPEKLPIIGKKAKKPPVLSAILVVFLVSGIWHGDTMCFVVWGLLQAIFRIGEEICHRILGKPKKKISLPRRIGKTFIVMFLWVESLIFFRVGMMQQTGETVGTVKLAFNTFLGQFSSISIKSTLQTFYNSIWNGFYNQKLLVFLFIFFMLVCLAIALWADWAQRFKLKGKSLATGIGLLSTKMRWFIYFFITLACFAAFIAQSGGYGGSSFLYGGF